MFSHQTTRNTLALFNNWNDLSSKQKTCVVTGIILITIGVLAMVALSLTQTSTLQTILDKYSITLVEKQIFIITLSTAVCGGSTLLMSIPFLVIPFYNTETPRAVGTINLASQALIFPQFFEIQHLNLGHDGAVKWDGPTRFSNLFIKNVFDYSFPNHSINTPSKNTKPDESFQYALKLGRSEYDSHSHLTRKKRKKGEGDEAMEKEARAQHFLQSKKKEWGLRSLFPSPIYWDTETLIYKTPAGYHTYLTDIDDEEQFNASLDICAHDLGCLMQKGMVYPELISIFHTEDVTYQESQKSSRIYTAFPGYVGHRSIVRGSSGEKFHPERGGTQIYGEFPGEIEKVCNPNHHLYPDLGKSGLRDVGDFVTIDAFVHDMQNLNKQDPHAMGRSTEKFTQITAIAHFISLYQIVFMLVIAKRQQRLELWDSQAIKKSFCSSCHTLLTAFLQLDPTQTELLKTHINDSIDEKKFTLQMRFCFTKQNRLDICNHDNNVCRTVSIDHKIQQWSPQMAQEVGESIPTNDAVKHIWGEQIIWTGHSLRNIDCLKGAYTPEKGFKNGCLGEDSAPNPLVEGFKGIFHFTYLALENFYSKLS